MTLSDNYFKFPPLLLSRMPNSPLRKMFLVKRTKLFLACGLVACFIYSTMVSVPDSKRVEEPLDSLTPDSFNLSETDVCMDNQTSHMLEPILDRHSIKAKHELCLVAIWGNEWKDYHSLFFKTASHPNAGKVFLFHDGRGQKLPIFTPQDNIHLDIINVGDLNVYFAKGICRAIGLDYEQEEKCQLLSKILERAHTTNQGSPIAQLRMFSGIIFDKWINPTQCKSWAYIDSDNMVGNLPKVTDNNPDFWDADVTTFTFGDTWRLHIRAQFTVHHQFR